MYVTPTPINEEARLQALYAVQLLDTLPDERFDRITRLASRMFSVPMAVITLVDRDRVWPKSSLGLGMEPGCALPRQGSFCGQSILSDDVLVVNDAKMDPRFQQSQMVLEPPNIRFYAGKAFAAADGSRIGSLGILDTKPREFSSIDCMTLCDLAALVEDEVTSLHLAYVDELTRIANRRGFIDMAQRSLDLMVRRDSHASLLFFDLNKFKSINDTYGHAAGDKALMAFARCLKGATRGSDLVARLAGDEFVVLLMDTNHAGIEAVLERLAKSIEEFHVRSSAPYRLSYCVGAAHYQPVKHTSIEALICDADAHMYQEKMPLQHSNQHH